MYIREKYTQKMYTKIKKKGPSKKSINRLKKWKARYTKVKAIGRFNRITH